MKYRNKKCVAAILAAASLSSYAQTSGTEVLNTGNIVVNTPQGGPSSWTNAVYQDKLTCWAGGQPGYCGPNAIVRPGNNINFSYGSTYIYQQQAVSSVLPNTTGLQVIGFNFGFTAKNGNGWDDGRVDQLSAVVRFWDTTGNKGPTNALEKYDYNLNYKFNWTTFNFSETFASPRSATTIGNVQYGFIGKDNNYWAGPYGPEVTNISFSLKYTVDPCSGNPTYSPTCPGYLDALNKMLPKTTTSDTTTVTTVTTSPTTTTTVVTEPVSTSTNTTSTATLVQPSPVVSSTSTTSSSTSSTTSTTAIVATAIPSAKETTKTTDGASIGLSVVAKNKEKEQAIAMQASQNAIQAAEQASVQAQQEASSVGAQAVANSVLVGQSALKSDSNNLANKTTSTNTDLTFQNNQSSTATTFLSPQNSVGLNQKQNDVTISVVNNTAMQTSGVTQNNSQQTTAIESSNRVSITQSMAVTAALELPKPPASSQVSTTTSSESSKPITTSAVSTTQVSSQVAVTIQEATNTTSSIYSLLPPQQTQNQQVNTQQTMPVETNQSSLYSLTATQQNLSFTNENTNIQLQSPFLDRSNPLSEYLENKSLLQQNNNIMQQGPTVNRNVSDNEVAGGVDITRLAIAPSGYNQYLNLIMRDAEFYAPREVYKNQRNVDNVRLLRQLASDRLHQEMVEQQYRRN